jgi:hypothetical protein
MGSTVGRYDFIAQGGKRKPQYLDGWSSSADRGAACSKVKVIRLSRRIHKNRIHADAIVMQRAARGIRNVNMSNNSPCLPTLFCREKTGRPSAIKIRMADMRNRARERSRWQVPFPHGNREQRSVSDPFFGSPALRRGNHQKHDDRDAFRTSTRAPMLRDEGNLSIAVLTDAT